MSGGAGGRTVEKNGEKVWMLPAYEHQVIVISLKGEINEQTMKKWNELMREMKNLAGDRMIAITLEGAATPDFWRNKKG